MTQRQSNEVERIRTRYGTVTTTERGNCLEVAVWGNGGHLPHLVVELDVYGQPVGGRKIRSRVSSTIHEVEAIEEVQQDIVQVMEAA